MQVLPLDVTQGYLFPWTAIRDPWQPLARLAFLNLDSSPFGHVCQQTEKSDKAHQRSLEEDRGGKEAATLPSM